MTESIEYLIKMKHYQAAMTTCQDLLEREPFDPHTMYLLAVTFTRMDNYPKAVEVLKQLVEIEPNDIDALFLLAVLNSWGYGDGYLAAGPLYRRVLAIDEYDPNAYIGLALLRGSPGIKMSIAESIKLLEQALELAPSSPEIHNNLAYAYWEAGEYQKAKEHFHQLQKVAKPGSYLNIGDALEEVSKHGKPQDVIYFGPALQLLNGEEDIHR